MSARGARRGPCPRPAPGVAEEILPVSGAGLLCAAGYRASGGIRPAGRLLLQQHVQGHRRGGRWRLPGAIRGPWPPARSGGHGEAQAVHGPGTRKVPEERGSALRVDHAQAPAVQRRDDPARVDPGAWHVTGKDLGDRVKRQRPARRRRRCWSGQGSVPGFLVNSSPPGSRSRRPETTASTGRSGMPRSRRQAREGASSSSPS